MIDTQGRLSRLFETQMSYSSVGQLADLFAHAASSLLPGHPAVRSEASYAQVPLIEPTVRVTLPRAGGGRVQLGPSTKPHLILFFDTWDSEVTESVAGTRGTRLLRDIGEPRGTAAADGRG